MKSLLLFLGLSILLLSTQTYAGHNETQREGCSWISKRFKMEAHVTLGVVAPVCLRRGGDCDYVYGRCGNYGACGAFAWSEAGWAGLFGGHNQCGGYITALNPALLMEFSDVIPDYDDSEYFNLQDIAVRPVFGNGAVELNEIQINMSSSSNSDWVNEYIITIWAPQDDIEKGIEDVTITDEKTLATSRIYVQSGKVHVQGSIFSQEDFEIKEDGDVVYIKYIGGNKTIAVPEQFLDKDLAVSSRGDAKPEQNKVLDKIVAQTSELSERITLYPNPATEELKFTVSTRNETNRIQYAVYDVMGRLTIAPQDAMGIDGQSETTVNIGTLPSGTYYLYISTGPEKTIKKFVKE